MGKNLKKSLKLLNRIAPCPFSLSLVRIENIAIKSFQ